MKVNELSNGLLDYWAAKANESWKWAHELFPTMTLDPTFKEVDAFDRSTGEKVCMLIPSNPFRQDHQVFSPSTNWEHGGPLIERESIAIWHCDGEWQASCGDPVRAIEICGPDGIGPTALVAAMRALVTIKFGAEIGDGVLA